MWTSKSHTGGATIITPSQVETVASEDPDALQRFTATGRPMPNIKYSALESMTCGDFSNARPQTLPVRFTDDSILMIPIPYSDLDVSASGSTTDANKDDGGLVLPERERRRSSLVGRLMGGEKKQKKDKKAKKSKEGFRLVRMTRGEYLMYWAKDEEGRYIGTEPVENRAEFWKLREST